MLIWKVAEPNFVLCGGDLGSMNEFDERLSLRNVHTNFPSVCVLQRLQPLSPPFSGGVAHYLSRPPLQSHIGWYLSKHS